MACSNEDFTDLLIKGWTCMNHEEPRGLRPIPGRVGRPEFALSQAIHVAPSEGIAVTAG
jgi:hypothetical protein